MPTIAQVLDARSAGLEQAALTWERVGRVVSDLGERLAGDVTRQVSGAWRGGIAAPLAQREIGRSGEQFDAAGAEIHAVARTMSTAADRLRDLQRRLDGVLQEAAARKLAVSRETGAVTWGPLESAGGEPATPEAVVAYQAERARAAADLTADITRILQEAARIDTETAAALRMNVGGDPKDFNATPDRSIAPDIAQATTLLRKPDLDAAELEQLTTLLATYDGDEVFAEALVRDLGPERLLGAQTTLASWPTGENSSMAQSLLGSTLATASPALAKEPDWMRRLLAAGRGTISGPTAGPFGRSGGPIFGYQSLGVLLRSGVYDRSFLEQVGTDMLRMDKEGDRGKIWMRVLAPPGVSPFAGAWAADGTIKLQGLGNEDLGYDPITGLMKALANNPDAASSFFATGGDERMRYLLTERDPAADSIARDESGKPWRSSVTATGDALVAATGGRPVTEEMAKVFASSVHVLGEHVPPKSLAPELEAGVVEMVGNNIQSVHATMSNPTDRRQPIHDPLFPGAPDYLAPVDRSDLARVISEIARNPGSMAELVEKESAFTGLGLRAIAEQHPPGVTAEGFLGDSAKVFGLFDAATAHNISIDQITGDKAANDKFALYTKTAGSIFGGVVSLVGDNAGDVIERGVNIGVEWLVAKHQTDTSEQARRQIAQVFGNGREYVFGLSDQWLDATGTRIPVYQVDSSYSSGGEILRGALGLEP
ncbi:hypothetical protein ACFZBU_00560 [Embleya sp. NPDC008237]|uniref:hypothetical protein n=1 Tax=Embleya sp. NPDC008237 TaxID=3363978 RepID=UPI0036E4A1D1